MVCCNGVGMVAESRTKMQMMKQSIKIIQEHPEFRGKLPLGCEVAQLNIAIILVARSSSGDNNVGVDTIFEYTNKIANGRQEWINNREKNH